ncbi:MAG: helix-turn-helix domain-containing protein [Dehalobacterium sp.]
MENQLSSEKAYKAFFTEYPDVLDLKQMCEILRISIKTGYVLIQNNKIRSLKIGRSYRIPKLFLLNYLGIGVWNDDA